jgi:hypothetical protein
MNPLEAFSVAASVFSIGLAIFAIWFSLQQRREAQQNFVLTKDVLNEIEKVMEKTEVLVSENFQNLLKSMTDQQMQMLESLKPKLTAEEKYADLFTKLAQGEPEKLTTVVDAILRVQQAQHQR